MLKFCWRKAFLLPICAFSLTSSAFGEVNNSTWILDYLRTVPDFPKAGVQFKCFSHLLRDPEAFSRAIEEFAERYRGSEVEAIAGLDSRGFIFGAALAYELKLPFVMIRKPGKLPGDVERIDYELEYGRNTFEVGRDSFQPGQKVLVIDDVLATGGTAAAACALVKRLGAEVFEVACVIELPALEGRKKIAHPVFSLISIGDDE